MNIATMNLSLSRPDVYKSLDNKYTIGKEIMRCFFKQKPDIYFYLGLTKSSCTAIGSFLDQLTLDLFFS